LSYIEIQFIQLGTVIFISGKYYHRRVSVCVFLSHAGIVSKQQNLGSRKQRHVIAQGL